MAGPGAGEPAPGLGAGPDRKISKKTKKTKNIWPARPARITEFLVYGSPKYGLPDYRITRGPGTQGPRDPGAHVSQDPGTLEPWCPGTQSQDPTPGPQWDPPPKK